MKSVCVFCGSSLGNHPAHHEAARHLGELLARERITLIYGGGHVGLMGVIADAVLGAGGQVVGVIPQFMIEKELAHERLTELIVVDSMHTRKAVMAERSDAFVALPGGYGTGDELFEILTWRQLRRACRKSCVIGACYWISDHFVRFKGNRPSNRMAKWFSACFQPTIGIVHFRDASLIAR